MNFFEFRASLKKHFGILRKKSPKNTPQSEASLKTSEALGVADVSLKSSQTSF